MGIINVAIWCFRACVCYSSLRRLKRIERHICKCLRYSNLLFFHALKNDNFEVDMAMARRDRQSSILESSFYGNTLEYKRHSSEIRPYYQIMESLHQEAGRFREELLDIFEESGHGIGCDLLGWDYGTPYPELGEEYQETKTVWTYSIMQSKYFDLFDAIQGSVKYKHKKFQQLLSFILLIPAANSWFQLHIAPPSRERIYKESSNLKAEYQELRSKTGADRFDHLSRI